MKTLVVKEEKDAFTEVIFDVSKRLQLKNGGSAGVIIPNLTIFSHASSEALGIRLSVSPTLLSKNTVPLPHHEDYWMVFQDISTTFSYCKCAKYEIQIPRNE